LLSTLFFRYRLVRKYRQLVLLLLNLLK
jgi:hypothetical protein